ncbi:protein-tyrosine phosphatase-like protein [Pyrenochaeta sp. MPI-SDFR-AT-0127]|nr:protein-tyrosine phosphatase-like protein [Pyrenochaeta sp. MPI-SDFR-AT-0127]
MTGLRPPLGSILNFRDVSEFVNEATHTRRLQTGLLYRCARPAQDEASFQDRQRLIHDYKVKSIIDLRTKTEHIEQARKQAANIKASAALSQTNDAVAEPLKMPNIAYYNINFNGSAFSRMLLSKLSWFEYIHLVGLMLLGYRLDAIKILSPHMEKMGLVGLAISSLDVCTYEVKQVFDVFAEEHNWPILVHCTQGKDRTGLVVMLVLFLLGVDEQAIDLDYRSSEAELASEKEARMKEIQSIGLSERFALCPSDVVKSVHAHLLEEYGGVCNYLAKIGVTTETIDIIKRKLLVDAQ